MVNYRLLAILFTRFFFALIPKVAAKNGTATYLRIVTLRFPLLKGFRANRAGHPFVTLEARSGLLFAVEYDKISTVSQLCDIDRKDREELYK